MGNRGNPNFVKGHKLATGRPKGSKNKLTLALQEAIAEVEKKKGKTLFTHFVERGFKSDNVLVALIRKLLADKTEAEIDLGGGLEIIIRYANEKDRGNTKP